MLRNKMNYIFFQIKFLSLSLLLISSCERDVPLINQQANTPATAYKTKNVVIVVIDGPRYSETWGDSTHGNIPNQYDLAKEGAVFTNFRNEGPTYTNAGYAALTTGTYQDIDNTGAEIPQNPSIFQYWLKKNGNNKEACWMIQSKGKLKILADCLDKNWTTEFTPSFNCGSDGVGNGYRNDSLTCAVALDVLKQHHPSLVLIGFKEPDYTAHANDWSGYIEGIKRADNYVFEIWNFINSDSLYRNTTAFFITNDHGRHLDGVNGGFAHHGDDCDGCRHISLFAAGPDFVTNKIIATPHDLTDISATVAGLLNFDFATGEGGMMGELVK